MIILWCLSSQENRRKCTLLWEIFHTYIHITRMTSPENITTRITGGYNLLLYLLTRDMTSYNMPQRLPVSFNPFIFLLLNTLIFKKWHRFKTPHIVFLRDSGFRFKTGWDSDSVNQLNLAAANFSFLVKFEW